MAGVLAGKLLSVTIDNEFVRCQTDATLTITTETETSDPCKPDETQRTDEANWAENTAGARSWSISFSAKSFADTLKLNNSDLLDKIINGSPNVEVEFATTETTDYDYDETFVFSGTGVLSSFTLNAPTTGDSTYDAEITGSGAPTFTRVPFSE